MKCRLQRIVSQFQKMSEGEGQEQQFAHESASAVIFWWESCNSSHRSTAQRGEGQTRLKGLISRVSLVLVVLKPQRVFGYKAPHTALGELWLTRGIITMALLLRGNLPIQSHFMNIWSRNIVDIKTFTCFLGEKNKELER